MIREHETVGYVCPKTGHKVDTGVKCSPASLARSWRVPLDLDCPYCKGRHRAFLRDIYIDMTVARLAEI